MAQLKRLFHLVAAAEAPRRKGNVNLIFTTDAAMRRFNLRFRGIDRSTDVLSFSLDEPDEADSTVGEVYISVRTAARQATEAGHGRFEEYLRLACHGFLHLFGYDHDVPARRRRMVSREALFRARRHGDC